MNKDFIPVNVDNIKNRISDILNSFALNSFSSFVKNLIKLKNDLIKYEPEALHLALVDLLMDENMWDWVNSTIDREPTEFDWTAAEYVVADLKDILKNNTIENDPLESEI